MKNIVTIFDNQFYFSLAAKIFSVFLISPGLFRAVRHLMLSNMYIYVHVYTYVVFPRPD